MIHTNVQFLIDFAKVKEMGGGSVVTFCKRNNLPRCHIYAINGKKAFNDGSKSQMIAEKLMILGIGKWVNIVKVDEVA
jgi:hypothetical protein